MSEKIKADFRIGCCGFPVSRALYFSTFRLVEVQQTFYEPPRVETLRRWREEAPRDFEFSLKAWQLITHQANSPTYRRLKTPLSQKEKNLVGNFQLTEPTLRAWEGTLEAARALQAKVVVFQCPASFRPTAENTGRMRAFFSRIDRGGLLLCWEPRGPWPPELVRQLCRELELVHCVDPFQTEPVYGSVRYFRLHGIGGYRYRYSDEELLRLRNLCTAEMVHYVLFNNTNMFEDAKRFLRILGDGR